MTRKLSPVRRRAVPWYRAFGARLRWWREIRCLTQDDVARRLGVTRSHICTVEAGHSAVLAHDLPRYARLYETTVAELLPE